MSERITDPDEDSPVRLFKSESRAQRMFQYAMLRTPGYSKTGKELLNVLAEVISDDQPTPQVGQVGEQVHCLWKAEGWEIELWVEENEDDYWDNEFVYTIMDNAETRGECSGSTEYEYYYRADVVPILKPLVDRLGDHVVEEHRIIK